MIALQIVETVVLGSCDEIIARGSSYYDAFTIFPDGGKNFLYDIFSRFPVRDKTFGIYPDIFPFRLVTRLLCLAFAVVHRPKFLLNKAEETTPFLSKYSFSSIEFTFANVRIPDLP